MSLTLLLSLASLNTARAETPAPAATPHPLMWVIKQGEATVYLFGSIHVMKDGVPWLTPQVRQRFDSADVLWLEVPDMDDGARVQKMWQTYATDPAGHMTQGLTPDEIKRLDDYLIPMGTSTGKMATVRKWAVGLILMQTQMHTLGYDAAKGVDMTLLDAARSAHKPVHGFETLEQQMQYLTPASDAEDIADLRESLDELKDGPAYLRDTLQAWEMGDAAGLTHSLIDKMKAEDPTEYQRIIVERNARWEPVIEGLLKGHQTTFIAVGTAHLIGPDSVIALLKAHGIMAQRVK